MKYSFKVMEFSKGKKIVRIHFENMDYEGLERFFNDDASVLKEELEEVFSTNPFRPTVLAGNRTTICIGDEVTIEDQWDNHSFETVTIPYSTFRFIYDDWKEQMI